MIRTLIVDDEPIARAKLRRLLREASDVEVVGEADTAESALAAIRVHEPDLVFLDIDMPLRTGFDAVAALDTDHSPLVVFATAYAEFAVRAFEVHALDYLLKPFDAERLGRTLDLVRARLRDPQRTIAESLGAMFEELRLERAALARAQSGAVAWPVRLLVSADQGFEFVRVDDIDWIASADNYVEVNAAGRRHLVRETLASVERRLDPLRFARIHRCTIVNLDRVTSLPSLPSGQLEVLLADGVRLPVGRAYRDRLMRRWHGASPNPT